MILKDLNLQSLTSELSRRVWDAGSEVNQGHTNPLLKLDPIPRLPNCSNFEIELSTFDKLMLKHGIKTRLQPSLKWTRYSNGRANKYLNYSVKRLHSNLDHSAKFWQISLLLLQKSNVYLVSCLRHIDKNWHRTMTRIRFEKFLNRIRRMRTTLPDIIDFKRVYILKSDGKSFRPLGVPTFEWRVYLNMWLNPLVIWLGPSMSPNQHGFIPGRGTLSAWLVILKTVIHKQDIWEFDLKNFFPSVSIDAITRCLHANAVPSNVYSYLEKLNLSAAKLPERLELPEESELSKQEIAKYLSEFGEVHTGSLLESFPGFKYKTIKRPEYVEYQRLTWRGCPQGSPLSPLLSTILLGDLLIHNRYRGNGEIIMYADDGLLFGDNLIDEDTETPGALRNAGISYHPTKCGWVKRNGIWLKPLHFLGIEYDGEKNLLRAKTRKGASLVFNKHALLADEIKIRQRQHAYMNPPQERPPFYPVNKKWTPRPIPKELPPYLTYEALGLDALIKVLSNMNFHQGLSLMKSLYFTYGEAFVKEYLSLYDERGTPSGMIPHESWEGKDSVILDLGDDSPQRVSSHELGIKTPNSSENMNPRPNELDNPDLYVTSFDGKTEMITLIVPGSGEQEFRKPQNLSEALDILNACGDLKYSSFKQGWSLGYYNWEHFIQSKLNGFVFSRLYNNSWELEFIQSFKYTYKPTSWADITNSVDRESSLTIFNSTSYANLSLLRYLSGRSKSLYQVHES